MARKVLLISLALAIAVFTFACDGEGSFPSIPVDHTGSPSPSSGPTHVASPPSKAQISPVVPDPHEVYVIGADGSGLSLISSAPVPITTSWSPDGKRLALSVDRGVATTDLQIITPPASSATVSVEVAGAVRGVVWSPTGEWLAFIRLARERMGLEVMRDDGSSRRELLASGRDDARIYVTGWLPGDRLLAISKEASQATLVEFDAASGGRREVAVLTGRVKSYDLSDRGDRVAVTVSGPRGPCYYWGSLDSLWVIEVASGQAQQVVTDTCGLGAVAWSPDGGEIAYTIVDIEGEGTGVYVVNVASGTTRRLTSPSPRFDTQVAWLPDSSAVLTRRSDCVACEPPPPSLVLVPLGGGPEQTVVDGGPYEVSPDARSIILASQGLQIMNMSGGEPRTLLPPDPDWLYANLSWSPDGQQVAFLRYHSEAVRQFEVNIDGSDLTRLPNLDLSVLPLPNPLRVPSPDGTKVAVRDFLLHIEDVESGEVKKLEPVNAGQVAWSPDSRRLAFTAGAGYAQRDLYVVNADGTGLKRLTNDSVSEFAPSFSPDGRVVAFLRRAQDRYQLATTHIGTLEERVLFSSETSGGSIEDRPVWSPNGRLLALFTASVDGRGIYVVNADGSGAYQLVAAGGVYHLVQIRWLAEDRLYFISVVSH